LIKALIQDEKLGPVRIKYESTVSGLDVNGSPTAQDNQKMGQDNLIFYDV